MTNDGRFWVRDTRTGRRFCVEPIAERTERRADFDSIQPNRSGSVLPEASIITPENGFVNITFTTNPLDEIARLTA